MAPSSGMGGAVKKRIHFMSAETRTPVGSTSVQDLPRVGDVVRWTPDQSDVGRFAIATVVCSHDGQVYLLQIRDRHGTWPYLQEFGPGCHVNPNYAYGIIERVALHDGLDARECCRRWRENARALEHGGMLPHVLTPDQLAAGRAESRAQDAGPWGRLLRALVAESSLSAAQRAPRVLLPGAELETANAPEPTLDEIRAYHARCAP